MKRIILLLILSIILISCTKNNSANEKEIKLSNGQKIKVTFAEKEVEKDLKVFTVDYQNNEKVTKEEIVEEQVLEVWKNIEKEANKTDADEAVIKTRYFIGNDEKSNEPIYLDFIFNGEKIENGTWKITKVN